MTTKEENQASPTVTRIYNSEFEAFKTKSTKELKRLLGICQLGLDHNLHYPHYFTHFGMIAYLLESRGYSGFRKEFDAQSKAWKKKARMRRPKKAA